MKISLITLFSLGLAYHGFCQDPWMTFNTSNSDLPDDWVRSIEIDAFGDKWFGTVYGGVAKFDNNSWDIFNTSNSGIAAHNVQAIHIDSLDNIWCGSGWTGKISRYDGVSWTVYDSNNTNGVIRDWMQIRDIITDKYGNILIGTGNNGIKRFDGTTWDEMSIPGNFIYDLALDPLQDLWIGHWNDGATFYDGINSINYNTTNSVLPSNDVTSIAIESNGTVWLATRYNGVVKFNGVSWSVYNMSNTSLPSNSFNSILIDHNNVKWFATGNGGTGAGSGIVKHDGSNWITYNTANSGIPSNDVISFAVDGNNNLWMGTQAHGVGVYHEGGVFLSLDDLINPEFDVRINPNPFLSNIELYFEQLGTHGYELRMTNSIGKIVHRESLEPHITHHNIDLNHLCPGFYFAVLINSKGEVITKRLVKI